MKKSNLRCAIAMIALIFGFAACQNDATKMYSVTVSSDIEHGSVTVDKTSVQEGDVVSLTVTADDGYSLEELSVKDSSDNLITLTDNTFAMPASNVTVNASFAKYFTVTYKSKHGTAPAAISVKENTALTAGQIAALSAEGFTFDAWYEGETKVEAGYKVTKSVTLTAKWGETKKDADSKTEAETATDADTKTNTETSTEENKEPEVVKFTVTYESAKGTAPAAISVEENAELTAEQLPTLSAEGFKFLGWYVDDTQIKAGNKVTKAITLTAKWIAQYTVSYTSDHATAPAAFTVDEGTALTAAQLPSLTESGFTFGGWFDGTTKVEAGDKVTKALTLTAKWEENSLPLVLWNSMNSENNIVWKNDDDWEYTDLESSGSYTKGIQLFDYKDRNNSLGITNPLWEASNLPFCFSDDIVYFVKDDCWIVGYKKDSTGFKEVFTKNILTLYNNIQESDSSYLSIKSITYCDQYLYFYFDALDENPYLGRLHLDENDENALSYTDFDSEPNITAMGIYKNESELNLIYISYENDNDNESSECIKTPIKDDTEFSLDQDNSASLYTMSSDVFTVRKISDLQIIGDTCYLLFAEYSHCIGGIPIAYYSLNDARIMLCTCTGGVVKIDLQTDSVGKWKNGSNILGEYRFNGSFYEPNEDWDYEEKNNSSITAVPPLEQANNYFYGPVKFIAKKPDALVIADDGIYIDAEIDEDAFISKLKKFKNMNRLVTLDLKNELMSAVDVNVTFNVSVDQDSSSFYIEDESN